jgi:hypothetical protein
LEQGFDVPGGTADEYDRVVKTHAAKFAKIIKEAEISTNRSRRHLCNAAWGRLTRTIVDTTPKKS